MDATAALEALAREEEEAAAAEREEEEEAAAAAAAEVKLVVMVKAGARRPCIVRSIACRGTLT